MDERKAVIKAEHIKKYFPVKEIWIIIFWRNWARCSARVVV